MACRDRLAPPGMGPKSGLCSCKSCSVKRFLPSRLPLSNLLLLKSLFAYAQHGPVDQRLGEAQAANYHLTTYIKAPTPSFEQLG